MIKNRTVTSKLLFIAALLLVVITPPIACRFKKIKVPISRIRRQKVSYVTKFHYKSGGKLFFNVKKEKAVGDTSLSLDVSIYVFKIRGHKRMRRVQGCKKKGEYAFINKNMQIHTDSVPWYKSLWISSTVNLETYYVYFADCENNLQHATQRDNLIFSFDMTTDEGGHFSYGEHYLLRMHYIFAFFVFLAYTPFLWKFYKEIKKASFSELNYPFMFINFIIFLKCCSIIMEIVELNWIKNTGHGNDVLSFLAQSFNYLTQYLICCLFIFLAAGWTITFD